MRKVLLFALFSIASCAYSTGAIAQKVYRCGSTYSHIPCPDAVAIDAQDPRSKAQESQANAAIKKEQSTANAMEKARLQQDAQAQKNTQAIAQSKKSSAPAPTKEVSKSVEVSSRLEPAKKHTATSKEPEYFTAKAAPSPQKPASTTP